LWISRISRFVNIVIDLKRNKESRWSCRSRESGPVISGWCPANMDWLCRCSWSAVWWFQLDPELSEKFGETPLYAQRTKLAWYLVRRSSRGSSIGKRGRKVPCRVSSIRCRHSLIYNSADWSILKSQVFNYVRFTSFCMQSLLQCQQTWIEMTCLCCHADLGMSLK